MRFVSWNIRGALGMDGQRSIERIAEHLRSMEADVICLQEVHRKLPGGGLDDQAARLGLMVGMRVHFSSAMRFGRRFGNAILSRWPLQSAGSLDLRNRRERRRPGLLWERRVLQHAEVSDDEGWVIVLNTHWSLDKDDRLVAAEIIADRVRAAAMPVVLCGDLNAPPDAAEVALLRECGLVDTGEPFGIPTFPADSPQARIDYVWVRGMRVSEATWVDSRASDHRPVVVDLSRETL